MGHGPSLSSKAYLTKSILFWPPSSSIFSMLLEGDLFPRGHVYKKTEIANFWDMFCPQFTRNSYFLHYSTLLVSWIDMKNILWLKKLLKRGLKYPPAVFGMLSVPVFIVWSKWAFLITVATKFRSSRVTSLNRISYFFKYLLK